MLSDVLNVKLKKVAFSQTLKRKNFHLNLFSITLTRQKDVGVENPLKFKKKANVLPVTGTWTLKYRGGILKKIYKIATTLRYKRKKEGWVNKMGLPNVGLNVGLRRTNKNEILSIADYSDLGILLIVVTLLTLLVPTISVIMIQKTKFKTDE